MVIGYHQIELVSREWPKTAFSSQQGPWEYQGLRFGLKTAPATFKKTYELDTDWANRYTLFCSFRQYRHLCQIAGGSQYQITIGVR